LRTLIVGAGIAGVATACELALAGHEVQVVERLASVAAEGSFADAGLASPALVGPSLLLPAWPPGRRAVPASAPTVRGRALRDAAVRVEAWRARRGSAGVARYHALAAAAAASQARRRALAAEWQIGYDASRGVLLPAATAGEAKVLRARMAALAAVHRAEAAPGRWVDAEEAGAIEPALAPQAVRAGAWWLPDDDAGNCRQFSHALKAQAQRLGAAFTFGRSVRVLRPGPTPAVELDNGQVLQADAVVLCTGTAHDDWLRAAGLRLPLRLLHGLSVTAPLPLDAGEAAVTHGPPRTAIADLASGVLITRLGDRVRAVGPLRPGAGPDTPSRSALQALYEALQARLPGAALVSRATHWQGRCATTPDGLPLIGASAIPGVWLHLGLGAHGWALTCGTAAALAAAMSGRPPAVDLAAFDPRRY
jgi:D-amino-acid dehydrogenase